MTSTDTELVTIPVPKQHLSRIYGFVATLDHPAGETAPLADAQPDTEAESVWTPDLVRRQFDESPDTIKRFQKLLAGSPGESFSTKTVAAQLNAAKGPKTIAGALGAYGRRTSNRYGMKTWPFAARWNHAEGQMYYSMEPETAEIIREL